MTGNRRGIFSKIWAWLNNPNQAKLTPANLHLIFSLIESCPVKQSPDGWEMTVNKGIGGLLFVGFSEINEELLLVISTAGKSIINCYTGELLFRDIDDKALDEVNLFSVGSDILNGEIIRLSGISGGCLPMVSCYGEAVRIVNTKTPDEEVIFEPAYCSIFYDDERRTKCIRLLSPISEIMACGFSKNGDILLIAENSSLKVWKRHKESNLPAEQ